jgi:hypothetical protein
MGEWALGRPSASIAGRHRPAPAAPAYAFFLREEVMFVIELAVAIVLVWFAANVIFAFAVEVWDMGAGALAKTVHDGERERALHREMEQHPELVAQRRADLQRRRARRARTIAAIISALSAATIAGWFS